ncbi:unnamed protein product [Medioppia subpectinata]|uniref:Uncharacterized protein n=1 Tax=Medioppia subpectinata TaxID=1979941 RepID=A0A7R9LI60_9ACAR|nr:unnamed protein product [Medioppia subpectinata]CAG2118665.1 unnamed protein product [Medioppia subpectinata]
MPTAGHFSPGTPTRGPAIRRLSRLLAPVVAFTLSISIRPTLWPLFGRRSPTDSIKSTFCWLSAGQTTGICQVNHCPVW